MKALGNALVIKTLTINSHHVTMPILDTASSFKIFTESSNHSRPPKQSSEHSSSYFNDLSFVQKIKDILTLCLEVIVHSHAVVRNNT